MSSVKSHFDKVSFGYTSASDRLLWKKFRTTEALAVSEMLPRISPTTSALDLGSGSGYYADLLHSHRITQLTCIDFSENMLNQIENPSYIKIVADIEVYKSNGKYDIILCAGALEFIKSPEKVFANVSTMLKSGGSFILLCPSKSFLGRIYRIYHRSHAISVRLYDRDELSSFGSKVGLRTVKTVNVFPFSIVAKFTNA